MLLKNGQTSHINIVTKKFGTVDPHPPKVYDKVLKKLLFPIDKRVENYYNSIK